MLALISAQELTDTGIGYVDTHLLASTMLMTGKIWMRDKRLAVQAQSLSTLYSEPPRV